VLDFEVLANRPDMLSVIGFAREVGTTYSLPVKPLVPEAAAIHAYGRCVGKAGGARPLPPVCGRRRGGENRAIPRVADVAAASRRRSAINNVVDVTNYVLLELGQPMHAFDLEKLAGREIRIRRARKGERIKTLDGVDRALDPEMLVIADADTAQAVAGVMGGGLSEVSSATKDDRARERVLRSQERPQEPARQLGLKTEASSRFERGRGRQRGAQRHRARDLASSRRLAREPRAAAPSTPIPRRSRQTHRAAPCAHRPECSGSRFQRRRRADSHGLGFQIRRTSAGWDVAAARRFASTCCARSTSSKRSRATTVRSIAGSLSAPRARPRAPPIRASNATASCAECCLPAGCSEALTFSFIDAGCGGAFRRRADNRADRNPLSAQFSVLRPSLLPGCCVGRAQQASRAHDVRLLRARARA
jgi:phenylalanyl-tRNA synthetase beta chain